MNDFDTINNLFQEQLRAKLPELVAASEAAHIDETGDFILLDIPCSSSYDRLLVFSRDIWIEIALHFKETRGPAEALIGLNNDLENELAEVVNETVEYLQELVTGKIVVDICRYRNFWFKPYFLAWFRDSSESPHKRTVRTIQWSSPDASQIS